MAKWKYSIKLHSAIAKADEMFDLSEVEKDCPEEAKEMLAVELEKALPLFRFASEIRKAKSIAKVNRILDKVLNTADAKSVWCGFPYQGEI